MNNVSALAGVDLSPVTTALTNAVSVGDIITLLASILTFGLPFVFMWFGIRKVIRIFRSAVMGGHISV